MDGNRKPTRAGPLQPGGNQRLHPRVSLGTPAVVNQPSLWPEPFEVVTENVSLGGAYFRSRHMFNSYDYFHCKLMLPGTGSVAGMEVHVSAVVVRVDDTRWKDEGRCGLGAFFVGLDERDEQAIRTFIQQRRPMTRSRS